MSRSRKTQIAIGVVALVIAGLIGVEIGRQTNAVSKIQAEFQGFDKIDGGSDVLAVMRITNTSSRSFMYYTVDEIASCGAEVALCRYREKVPTVWREWNEPLSSPITGGRFLKPGATALVAAKVSKTNAVCQIRVLFVRELPRWPEPLQQVRQLWWKLIPPKSRSVPAWCEMENPTNSSSPLQPGGIGSRLNLRLPSASPPD